MYIKEQLISIIQTEVKRQGLRPTAKAFGLKVGAVRSILEGRDTRLSNVDKVFETVGKYQYFENYGLIRYTELKPILNELNLRDFASIEEILNKITDIKYAQSSGSKYLVKSEKERGYIENIRNFENMGELYTSAAIIRKLTDLITEIESSPQNAIAEPRSEYGSTRYVAVVELDASAGNGSAVLNESKTGHLAFRRSWLDRCGLNPVQCVVISVRGESMEPTLPDGCSILVNRGRRKRMKEHIYVLRTDDGVVVKRLGKDNDGKWCLESDHPAWSPVPWTDACEVIGEVALDGKGIRLIGQ